MTGRIEVELEFLRRLLGVVDDGDDSSGIAVYPGTWPDDLPLRWPDLPGTRVWGGVRSAATRWTFAYGNRSQPPVARELTRWRVCLDVAGPQPEVMAALRTAFAAQDWRAAQMWQQAFVEHAQTTWNAVQAASSRLLTLQTRRVAGEDVTGVWLTVQELEEEAANHWLGHSSRPQFSDFYQAPLPTLSAPPGWQVVGQGGSGGADRSDTALLVPPEGQNVDLAALLAAFGPQLAAQGWTVLPLASENEENSVRLAAQTSEGFGALGLDRTDGTVTAKLVHMVFGQPETGGRSTYTLVSS